MRNATTLTAFVLAAVPVMGCGDDEDAGISRQEYIARSGAICDSTAQKSEVAFKREAIIAAGEKALRGFDEVASGRAKTRALFEGKLADPAKEFDALSRRYGIAKCGGDQ